MILLAIDPGTTESAYVLWDTVERRPIAKDKVANQALLDSMSNDCARIDQCVIEECVSYGCSVGRSVYTTIFWAGRMAQHWLHLTGKEASLMSRPDVKLSICGSRRANDKDVREELIHRLGPVGDKKNPGPLYQFTADRWAALALSVAFSEAMGFKC